MRDSSELWPYEEDWFSASRPPVASFASLRPHMQTLFWAAMVEQAWKAEARLQAAGLS